jgi:glycosyltransferase involved in cell wall biosynthesis
VHGEVAGAISLLLLARRPSVLTLHGLHLLRRVDGAAAAAAQVNLRLLTRAATRTICVSEAERAEVLSVVSARMAPRVIVIHNGVAVTAPPRAEEREAARFEFGISDSSIVAAFVGSLDDRKSPLTAVRAAIEVARGGIPIVLLVAGDGPLRPDVERAAEEERDVVRAIGFRSDPERVLAACDFFVLPSSREGLPYSLLEAMAIGVPAVVSDTPGNLEALGDTGIVAPHGNVAAFAAGIRELAVNITRRRSLGDAARRRVLERFGLDEMLRRTRQAYDEVLDERTARRRLP